MLVRANVALVSLALLATPTGDASAQPRHPAPLPGDDGGWVTIGCANPGTQQDTAKTPRIENSTSAAIPRGRSLLWRASDGDHGGVTLGGDLLPGESVRGTGKPARIVYTCTAVFHGGLPDLVVASTSFRLDATVVVKNANPWIDAAPASAEFELVRCADDRVLATEYIGPHAVAASATQTFSAKTRKPLKGPPAYWRVTLDFDARVAESNENNNVWANRSTCPH